MYNGDLLLRRCEAVSPTPFDYSTQLVKGGQRTYTGDPRSIGAGSNSMYRRMITRGELEWRGRLI